MTTLLSHSFRLLPVILAIVLGAQAPTPDPLPSWNAGPVKQSIVSFVAQATDKNGAGYIAPNDRIAVFDNDGTLWSEQPIYVQLAFALDRVKELAPQHVEWKATQPFKAVLDGDLAALEEAGAKGLGELIMATHTGMTTDEFAITAKDWLTRARHSACDCPYTDRIYTPMLELLSYLRANGFKPYIVSGGGAEFMRAFAEPVYGIPPEQVIGTTFATQFKLGPDGRPELVRESRIEFVDDGPGKPVGINKFIGRRPVFAFGNSDGDRQMLEWTAAGSGPRFVGLIHHTDGQREYAYDRASKIGRLDEALDEANAKGWTVVDMGRDWRIVFPEAGGKQASRGVQP